MIARQGGTVIRALGTLVGLVVLCAVARSAAASNRFALVIGNDAGDRDEQQLRYGELDDALGTETVTAIFCAEHFDPLTVDLGRCTSDRFTLDKVAR